MKNTTTQKTIQFAGYSTIIIFFIALLEVFSYSTLHFVPQLSRFIYKAPNFQKADFNRYMAERDPELGWPSKTWLQTFTDEGGWRRSPASDALPQQGPCISLYGDSMTFSDEVEDQFAWGNVMAERLGCRVANYGVSGYGTDQAQLRFERHVAQGRELGEVIVMGVLPANLNRTVNQWRYFLVTSNPFGFKPVFSMEGDRAILVPVFSGDFEQFRSLERNPQEYLAHDAYVPGSDNFLAPIDTPSFPYSWSLFKLMKKLITNFRFSQIGEKSNFLNYPVYFDDRDGMSKRKVQVFEHIVDRFRSTCEEQSKRCILLLIPDAELVLQRQRSGQHSLEWLAESIPPTLEYIDATDIYDKVEHYCSVLSNPDICYGHFDPEGYRLLADFVLQKMENSP